MQRMLEAYLAFARGAAGESAVKIDMIEFLEELRYRRRARGLRRQDRLFAAIRT